MSQAPEFIGEVKPVLIFGARTDPGEAPGPGAFKLAREIATNGGDRLGFGAAIPPSRERRMFTVLSADPVTTRVLQLWRPRAHESLVKWIDEFIKLRPLDPLLCWLVVMRAIEVPDVLDAIGEYGWASLAAEARLPARARFADVRGDFAEFRRQVDWSLQECESRAGLEWLDRAVADGLLMACEAALAAEAAEKGERALPGAVRL